MLREIDVYEFTRGAQSAEGVLAISALDRLASLLANAAGDLGWRLDGWCDRDAAGHERLRLRLRLSGSVGMRCGRCLGVARFPLAIDRGFILARSESDAEQLDEDEEELDALVASKKFDVLGLLEDEAILALPPAPSHAECSRPASHAGSETDGAAADPRPNPFAGLAALKSKRST